MSDFLSEAIATDLYRDALDCLTAINEGDKKTAHEKADWIIKTANDMKLMANAGVKPNQFKESQTSLAQDHSKTSLNDALGTLLSLMKRRNEMPESLNVGSISDTEECLDEEDGTPV